MLKMKVVIFTVILDSVILDIWLIRMIRPVKLCQNQYLFRNRGKAPVYNKEKDGGQLYSSTRVCFDTLIIQWLRY